MRVIREPIQPTKNNVDQIDNTFSLISQHISSAQREWISRYHRDHRIRLAFDLQYVESLASREYKILDAGAAPFLLTGSLLAKGYDVTAIDLDPGRLGKAINNLGINAIKSDIENEEIPLPDSEFDLIIFNELFEHLRINLIFTMTEILRLLKPEGILVLSTPNLKSLVGIYNFIFKSQSYSCIDGIYSEYEKLSKLGHMGHVREYTPREVIKFLEEVGFKSRDITYRGQYSNPIATLITRIKPELRPFAMFTFTK